MLPRSYATLVAWKNPRSCARNLARTRSQSPFRLHPYALIIILPREPRPVVMALVFCLMNNRICSTLALAFSLASFAPADDRPNILLAIGDDISSAGLGCYGAEYVDTPTFDGLADKGVLFHNAYASAPGCSPSRAALLTGKYIWEIQEAGTHGSDFPSELKVYPALLEAEGYVTGYTGKPWGPGRLTERDRNPAGVAYNNHTLDTAPAQGISNKDYAANFQQFLEERSDDKPFVFWFGAHEAHRVFEAGSGEKNGIDMDRVVVPGFLPDTELTREDVADYGLEIEWFDSHLGKMLKMLGEAGELENTIVVVTADNGMAFPRAKANNYEYGVRMPLIVSWGSGIPSVGRRVDDFVSLIDLAPTFLEAAGVSAPREMSGKSLMAILKSSESGRIEAERNYILSGRERHTHARVENLGYPIRALHTAKFNYIRNLFPGRSPTGIEFKDVDPSPSHSLMLSDMGSPLTQLAYGPRPLEELYDKENDPYCLKNLASNPEYRPILDMMNGILETELRKGGDPRILGYGDIFDSYPRYSSTRSYPGFNTSGKYHPEYVERARAGMKELGIANPGYERRVAANESESGRPPSK